DEHGQLQAGDALAVEQGDAFGGDELRPHPQSGDEGRGHALAALVEELHDGVVGADGHDDFGALVVGDEYGDVLGGAGGGESHAVDAERVDEFEAQGVAVAVGVDDDLGPGGQGGVGNGVHIADDHVRSVAGLDDGVGAAVDADEQRP